MFDLRQLERAHEVVGTAIPPTPAHAWPLLARAARHELSWSSTRTTPRPAPSRCAADLVYSRPPQARAAACRRADFGDHRQSRPEPGFRRPPLWRAGDDLCAARQLGREKPRDAGLRRQPCRTRQRFSVRARGSRTPGRRDGLEFVPSFHPDLVLGVATYALELFRAAPDLDVLYVPIGLGSGICGCILARDLLGLKTEIVGVQSTRSAVLRAVVRGGHGRDDRNQQHAAPTAWRPASPTRMRLNHPQGRFPHRAGERRRDRRRRSAPTGPIRIISPKARAQRRWRPRFRKRQSCAASGSA